MILFDSSIWIDHFNRQSNQKSNFLSVLMLGQQKVLITPTIVQEVLQGFSNASFFDIAQIVLTEQHFLDYDPVEAAIYAAKLYANLRKKGVTIRKSNDCLIAAYALHFDVELCHNDSDFDLIAVHTAMKVWKPSQKI